MRLNDYGIQICIDCWIAVGFERQRYCVTTLDRDTLDNKIRPDVVGARDVTIRFKHGSEQIIWCKSSGSVTSTSPILYSKLGSCSGLLNELNGYIDLDGDALFEILARHI